MSNWLARKLTIDFVYRSSCRRSTLRASLDNVRTIHHRQRNTRGKTRTWDEFLPPPDLSIYLPDASDS